MVKPSNYYDRIHMKQAALSGKAEADSQHGTLPKKAAGAAGVTARRSGRNCKTRGSNQRADVVVHNNFSPEQEELVIKLHATIGSRWSIIAQQIPERSDDDVKNLWNSKLKKKLSAMGIDPITHRPFSQILADYGNIGRSMHKNLPTTRFGYINPFIPEESSSQMTRFPSTNHEEEEEEDHSAELLSQLEAIKMVTQASNYSNTSSILDAPTNECISSSPHQAVTNKGLGLASPNFSWRDFLSDQDTLILPAQDDHGKQHIIFIAEEQKHLEEPINHCFEQGSSASFVQGIIERENQIFSQTHDILEEPFYY